MELLIGFLLGILGSWLASVGHMRYQNLKLTKRYSKYKGHYIHCDLKGEPLKGQELWTQIIDVDRGLLTLKGSDYGGREWTSRILMDDRFPGFGSGHYRYLSAAESNWGLHTIQLVDDGETILVQVQNISSGKNRTYPLLWKRAPKGLSNA